ncbi:MAG: glutamine--fructose-6-phosphate transaminase (isomerizing) [Sphaerochaetaceae bacterium]|nr:glutamine--fructose-6-phosphate transaminase (isomerizing) [Sphaerochaetaceae bacterium]MDC7236237.1 glutamine--fructose-6-phosphate transaminase (isomerizing) [Sphaerochaetaceae bacterium]MDC7248760.1 glutamine--fructose-6-phosphate transaminase (isomerizing) [Sphaerochaetaceae bacterium]
MCGIVGFCSNKEDGVDASTILLDCLSKLEYRGYDSAGIAVLNDGDLLIRKAKGRLSNLINLVEKQPVEGFVGIGHTRWATHGEPSDINSHPHTDVSNDIAVVHNGIIENHVKLRAWLEKHNVKFRSETDTECIAHLIDFHYNGDLLLAVTEALKRLEGSYAIAVVCKSEPNSIVVARKDCPLIIGRSEKYNLLASDVTPLLEYTREVQYIDDNQIAKITPTSVDIYDVEGSKIDVEITHVDWDMQSAQKNGFEHFMLKEIFEQPYAIEQTFKARVYAGKLDLGDITEAVKKAKRVVIVGCGTAYHAGVIARYAIEHYARIPVEVDVASEFRYRDPIIFEDDLCLVISQSGETADTLQAMRIFKKKGAKIIAITNVVGSTVSRESDYVMYTQAGPEIAVASTKAFTTQLMCVYLLTCALIKDETKAKELMAELETLSTKSQLIIDRQKEIQRFAARQFNKPKVFYFGRQSDFAISLESALKLKEINYTHSEAFAAGELKHGPIALLDEDTLVVATCCNKTLYDKMDSNIKEVKARGAKVLAITYENNKEFDTVADTVFHIPETDAYLSPILSVIVTQLYAYYCSVNRGNDPDHPRNLAKSVTVE